MATHRCPHCGSVFSLATRHARKCRDCRREWVPNRWLVQGIHASQKEWRYFLRCFLRYRSVGMIRVHWHASEKTVIKMSWVVRKVMAQDVPHPLTGVVEVDETYIAGMWHNKRWRIRKHGTKRGRGTTKQPIFGIYERGREVVRCFLVPDVRKSTLMPIMQQSILKGSTIYSDAYQLYRETKKEGYVHDYVDHNKNEYGRGEVYTNSIEGFWGILKRRLKTTGGIRRERLSSYVAEEVWRYNHRKLTEREKLDRVLSLLKR